MRALLSLGLLITVGCTAPAVSANPTAPELRPYHTATQAATGTLAGGLVVTPAAPAASPTPFQYTIQGGDTLSQIAEKFHVSLDALVAENPGLAPNAMPVGKVIKIPSNPAIVTGVATPTAAPLLVTQVACHPTANGGLWCFALVHNDSPDVVENVTGQVTLVGADGQPIDSKVSVLPLDILAPDQSLPLSVYFPPGVPDGTIPQVQILTAMDLLQSDPRYLPAAVQHSLAQVSWSGLTAEVTGEVFLPDDSAGASTIWVAAIAYDQAGNVIGLRRWESGTGLNAGASLSFSFVLPAVAGRIERVEYAVEARP